MKNLIISIVLLGSLNILYAQKPIDRAEEASKTIMQNFKDMLDKAKFENPKKDVPCEAYPTLKSFKTADLMPLKKDVYNYFKGLINGYERDLDKLEAPIVKGAKALEKLSKAKSFKQFVEGLTGKKIKDLSKKDTAILRAYYTYHPLKNGAAMISKPKKFAEVQDCFATAIHELSPEQWKHPNLVWDFKTTVTITCDCDSDNYIVLNEAVFEFDTAMSGVFDTDKISFSRVIGPGPVPYSVNIISSSCCPLEEPIEGASIQLDPNENTSLPNQMLGVNAGVGFGQDFEEISFCVGGEFLFNVTDIGSSPLFVGVNAQVETSSFMDTSAFSTSAGPTAQLFTPITTHGDVQMTNGINGNYVIGSNDSNGFKTDINGFNIILNSGLNVQLNDDVSLSLLIPIVSHQNLTFEAQEGGATFELSETTIFLNKNNLVKLGLRFGL